MVAVIRQEREDNTSAVITAAEEKALLQVASGDLRSLIVIALDTGLRRGEILALTWADVDARAGWLRVRGETAKSGKTRWVPVSTTRPRAVFDYLRLDSEGEKKPADGPVIGDETGEPIKFPRAAWTAAILRSHGIEPRRAEGRAGRGRHSDDCRDALRRIDLHWHDLRHEYAARLVERGVLLSQVRDLLGHASIGHYGTL